MFTIQTLNNISASGLERLPQDAYTVTDSAEAPDAFMLRSFKMHGMEMPESVVAVARAGAGTNNVPVDELAKAGVVVFNTPGANANAVKELVLAGMLMAARNIAAGHDFAKGLEGTDDEIGKAVESGKKNYVGFELTGKTLGVVGLGAIGRKVAESAAALGMTVVGYDPVPGVDAGPVVEKLDDLDELFRRSNVVTVHVPLLDATKGMVNAERIAAMADPAVVINFARGPIVDEAAVVAALADGKLAGYVCDFPTNALKGNPKVVALPHLGASTGEAEDNCAAMAADELRGFLEQGVIVNSVNFPAVSADDRAEGVTRLAVAHDAGVDVAAGVEELGLAVASHASGERGDAAYTLIDIDGSVADDAVEQLKALAGVRRVRVIA